ncbi:hypothetical protein GALL_502980 [mine drainage metagenome]|uniref:Uncharacterized protein n=1 Tax=mine drainage metagenome TaxID=410659 RepID=A0A1J5PBL0_9ZZZZ
MDDALRVGGLETVADLGHHLQEGPGREGLVAKLALQAGALHHLHGEVEESVGLAEFVDGHHVRVVQPGGGLGLPGEAGLQIAQGLRVREGPDGLEGHLAPQRRVPRQEHLAHGPLAQGAEDLELADVVGHGGSRKVILGKSFWILDPEPWDCVKAEAIPGANDQGSPPRHQGTKKTKGPCFCSSRCLILICRHS